MDRYDRLFLGTTDSLIVNQVEKFAQEIGPVETFVGVMGGFACFTLIEKIRPQKIILYDRNPTQLGVFNLIKSLIKISSAPEDFVSRLLSRSNFLENQPADKSLFEDTLIKLKTSSDFAPSWVPILSALATAQAWDNGVYFTPDTNGGRPLFVLNPLQYDLNREELKNYLHFEPLSLYLGQGWLKDNDSFQYIKNRLLDDTAETIELKIPKIKPLKNVWSSVSNLLWVSNIRFFKHWKEYPAEERWKFLHRLPENIKILTNKKVLMPAELLDL